METNRQKKIAGVLQKDLVDVLQSAARGGVKGVLISVTKVQVTSDLSQAKVFLILSLLIAHLFYPQEKYSKIL